ncbi:AgmX/PglI C-terminal domain-containing protein [bacterium]|nr:AgmX/PglI C-terminal domain-containing protein [bacterium]
MVKVATDRVLRVGVISQGKILDEQVFRKPETVYIGDNVRAHFVIPSGDFPSRFPLFYYKSGRYELVIMPHMTGKVNLRGKIVVLEDAIKKGILKKRGSAWVLPLTSDARGKVKVGSVSVLFQFIPPPPKPPKLKLPRSIRGSVLQTMDWPYFWLQVFFLTVGYLFYGVYIPSLPKPAPTTLEDMSSRFAKLIAPDLDQEELKKEEETNEKDLKSNAQTKVAKKEEEVKIKPRNKRKTPRSKAQREQEEAVRRAEIQKKVAGMGLLKIIGGKGENGEGGIISDVLGDGGKDRDIDTVLKGVKHIGIATNASQRSRKGDAEGAKSAKIGDLNIKKSSGKVALTARKERKVSARTSFGRPDIDGSMDSKSVSKVVRRHSRAIKRCYEKALKANPKLKGKIVVDWTINMKGRVEHAAIASDTIRDSGMKKCILSTVRRMRFPKPTDGPVPLSYPFIFSPSN